MRVLCRSDPIQILSVRPDPVRSDPIRSDSGFVNGREFLVTTNKTPQDKMNTLTRKADEYFEFPVFYFNKYKLVILFRFNSTALNRDIYKPKINCATAFLLTYKIWSHAAILNMSKHCLAIGCYLRNPQNERANQRRPCWSCDTSNLRSGRILASLSYSLTWVAR